MSLRFTTAAEAELASIHDFIAESDPVAADRVVGRIFKSLGNVENFPFIGRKGRLPGTREWSISGTRYFVVYRVIGGDVEVLAIIHTSRNWP